ncbi:ammonium transporter [Ketobacter alkanivorans]|uniref:Ammonium transporter n=1 Tax=Ketobacter alkanivorans TaxID=1917421 RepID=A0A2K9LMJ1_9GAMM|nr:ammonium transporter [Ketobacter alkanivorans]AUM13361.1 ammonium transporter [Ketobacter alkanivorans]
MLRLALLVLTALPLDAFAADGGDPVNTVWLVIAAALVFFMQTGFALLESGMSRSKNAVNVVMKNYMDVCLGSMVFWAVGFGIMFGVNDTGFFGTSHWLPKFEDEWSYTFLLFQIMFAATATTIASGAMAERTRYSGYLVGAIIITALIYPVFGSWVWGGFFGGKGWLAELGFVDFAGSTVVHSVGAWCALAGILVVGPRLGRFDPASGVARAIPGHNLNNVALGGFILWLGWFGFNAGSTLQADSSLGKIALNTHLAACSGAVGIFLCQSLLRKPVLLTHTINGSLGGLVAITAGCATMSPTFAVVTGLIAGMIVMVGSYLLELLQLDDAVGAIPVHGFAGIWGTLAAGLFMEGDLFNLQQVGVQAVGCIVAFLWAFPTALLTYWLLEKLIGLRASNLDQQRGLDYSEHAERGYPEFDRLPLHKPLAN